MVIQQHITLLRQFQPLLSQPFLLFVAFTLLATTHVTADLLVEQPEAVSQEVTDVRQVEEGKRDADDGVDDCHQAAPCCFRRYVPVA